MAGKITVVGLGAGDMDQLTIGIHKLLTKADTLYVRTKDHPLIEELEKETKNIRFFDDIYEKHDQFEAVYEEIADILFEAARREDVVYAVPGHPLSQKNSSAADGAAGKGKRSSESRGGQSFLDATFNVLQIDPIEGFQFVDAGTLSADELELRHHLIICQVYDQMTASEVKLTLMEKLPDDYEVVIVTAAGSRGEEIRTVPLFELDRNVALNNLTSVYIPPIKEEKLLYHEFSTFRSIIRELRGPNGCPWDKKQTHQSLKQYMIEECYELHRSY